MTKGSLWLATSGVTHCGRKKPHQATACLLVQWLCCCPPPSLPYFAPEPTWQTLHRSILKLFLVSFWYQPQGSGVTRAKAVRFVAVPAVPSLVAPKSEHTQRTSCAKYGSNLIRELSQLLPKWVSAFVPAWGEKKKKKERKRKDQSVNCKTSCSARWKWKQSDQRNNRRGCNWSAFSSSSLE